MVLHETFLSISSPQTLTPSEISRISGILEERGVWKVFLKNEYTKPQLFYNNIPVIKSVYCYFYFEIIIHTTLVVVVVSNISVICRNISGTQSNSVLYISFQKYTIQQQQQPLLFLFLWKMTAFEVGLLIVTFNCKTQLVMWSQHGSPVNTFSEKHVKNVCFN